MRNSTYTKGCIAATIFLIASLPGCEKKAVPPASAPAANAATTAPAAEPAAAKVVTIKPPLGLEAVPVPADNPMTDAKVELGRMLYFDKRLSKDATISCATCHDPNTAWTEHRATSEGIGKQLGGRNSPTVINAAYMPVMFWDGRAPSLEEQALGPIENPVEMGHAMVDLVTNLKNIPEYKKRFQEVFGTEVTKEGIGHAIAAFERTILSGNSPYDKYTAGDKAAMNEQQVRGMELFNGKAGCADCHTPPVFSNGKYYNAGIGSDKPNADPGRKKVTNLDSDLGKFRVPHLRNVADTYPYFHDGSVEKLEDAVRIMATGGIDNPNLSTSFKGVKEAKLTEVEIADLVAFTKALSGEYPIINAPDLPK